MPLRDDQRARYARHLLLPELGEAGQLRLLAGRARFAHGADAGAREVAASYLARAGVAETATEATDRAEDGATQTQTVDVELASTAECARLAGRPELWEAARSLAGAVAAVEAIKQLAGLGRPGARLPDGILFAEDA